MEKKLDGDMDAHMETARRVFETANTLGAGYIRMFNFYAPDGDINIKSVFAKGERVI